jgi:hypothetical protein
MIDPPLVVLIQLSAHAGVRQRRVNSVAHSAGPVARSINRSVLADSGGGADKGRHMSPQSAQ